MDSVIGNYPFHHNPADFIIGMSNGGWFPYYCHGDLDDIGIWNRALTQSEISNLFLSQNAPLSLGIENKSDVSLFPNPAINSVTIKIENTDFSEKKLRVYNTSYQLMEEITFNDF